MLRSGITKNELDHGIGKPALSKVQSAAAIQSKPLIGKPNSYEEKAKPMTDKTENTIPGEFNRNWVALKPANGQRVKPKLNKTTISSPDPMHCGAFDWEVKWGLSPVNSSVNGWIVQRVRKINYYWPCSKSSTLLTIKKDLPFWEAWQVKNGKIYIGRGPQRHKKDSYYQGMVGNGSKGRTLIDGRAEFYENLKLPSTFTPYNSKTNAHSLPSTITDPGALPGGTGAISHSIVVGWNCCPGRNFKQKKTQIIKSW